MGHAAIHFQRPGLKVSIISVHVQEKKKVLGQDSYKIQHNIFWPMKDDNYRRFPSHEIDHGRFSETNTDRNWSISKF